MAASIEFFPVGNGDMTLLRLHSGKTILVDINIRQNADNESAEEFPDVASMLKERLDRDADGRLYVDVFMLSHPDRDHVSGLSKHFHLGAPSTWKKPEDGEDEKIIVREMWSSPLTFRRADKVDGKLIPEAEKWKKEAKRRVELFRKNDQAADQDGNFIRVLGDDIHHKKTDGIERLIVKAGQTIDEIFRHKDSTFSALLLSPKVVSKEEADKLSGKNNSSIAVQFSLATGEGNGFSAKFLTGGDAEVDVWKRVWGRNKSNVKSLEYDILQTPHHCSLGSLSYDQYSDGNGKSGKGEDCKLDSEAFDALSQAKQNAFIVGSMDVPEKESGRGLARRKYTKLADSVGGKMLCTMADSKDRPLKITINGSGPTLSGPKKSGQAVPPKVGKGKTEKSYA